MKCSGKDKIVIGIDILQAWIEVSLVYQTSSLIDNYQSKDNPVNTSVSTRKASYKLRKHVQHFEIKRASRPKRHARRYHGTASALEIKWASL
jgi:hypothetical protein